MATFGQRCKGFGMRSLRYSLGGAHRCCRTPIHWFCQDPWFDSISRKTHWNVAGCRVSLMNRRFLERLVNCKSFHSFEIACLGHFTQMSKRKQIPLDADFRSFHERFQALALTLRSLTKALWKLRAKWTNFHSCSIRARPPTKADTLTNTNV